MNKRRRQLAPIQRKAKERRELLQKERLAGLTHGIEDEVLHTQGESGYNVDEEELQETFEDADNGKNLLEIQISFLVIMPQLQLFKINNWQFLHHLQMKPKMLLLI